MPAARAHYACPIRCCVLIFRTRLPTAACNASRAASTSMTTFSRLLWPMTIIVGWTLLRAKWIVPRIAKQSPARRSREPARLGSLA